MEGGIGGVEYPPADVVVHLAAHAKVHQLVREPARALENMTMTFNVLEYCRQTQTPIIFSSSREVYGDVHRFQTEEGTADFAYAESTYSASKIAGEALVYSYARCYQLPYIVFRFSNVYGRYDNDLGRMIRVIPLFTHRILRGEPITVFGGNDKVLDFTYVDDCVEGIVRGITGLADGKRAQRDDQPRLRPGQHARPRGGADRRGDRQGAGRDARAAAARRGDAVRGRHRPRPRRARLGAVRAARHRDRAQRRLVQRVATGPSRGRPAARARGLGARRPRRPRSTSRR